MPASFVAGLPPEFPFPSPHPGSAKPEYPAPPVPVVYESSELEKMSLRVYAAIQLRVPDSGLEWLDEMIRKSRELDERAPGK
jgi:hypothetical protein